MFLEPDSEGNEYFKVGDYARAIEAYSKAIELQPSNAVLYSNRRCGPPPLHRLTIVVPRQRAPASCNLFSSHLV